MEIKKTSFTVEELVAAIKEIGLTPGMEMYQPVLKEMIWVLKDHVAMVASLKEKVPRLNNTNHVPSAVSRLTGFTPGNT